MIGIFFPSIVFVEKNRNRVSRNDLFWREGHFESDEIIYLVPENLKIPGKPDFWKFSSIFHGKLNLVWILFSSEIYYFWEPYIERKTFRCAEHNEKNEALEYSLKILKIMSFLIFLKFPSTKKSKSFPHQIQYLNSIEFGIRYGVRKKMSQRS